LACDHLLRAIDLLFQLPICLIRFESPYYQKHNLCDMAFPSFSKEKEYAEFLGLALHSNTYDTDFLFQFLEIP